MEVKTLHPVACERTVDILTYALNMARRGELRDVVVVGALTVPGGAPSYYAGCAFDDVWRTLGAIEYARNSVLVVNNESQESMY